MVSVGKYLLVQVLFFLVNISRTLTQSCSSYAVELKASPHTSSYLTSPNYPSNYPPSQACQWKITAPAGHVVELKFLDFSLKGRISRNRCKGWTGDYLAIYDGNYADQKLLGRYCSSFLPQNVFSSGMTLSLEFRSDEYSERRGFQLEYSATVPKPDSSICSPFNTYSQNNNIQLSGSSGYIKSPLYGTKYPSNMQCTWVISVSKGKKIKLTFLDFSVGQDSYYCSVADDYLEIRDGQSEESNLINHYCSSSKPSPVHSTGRYLWIRFKSNSDNYLDEENGRKTNGFKAKFEEEMSGVVAAVIGIVIAVAVVSIIIVVHIQRKKRGRRRPPSHARTRQPVTQTTLTYNNQNTPSAPPYPAVHYSPAAQSSYPPPGSHPMSTNDGTAQPSEPMNDHPSSSLLNDPPPAYPEVVPDVPPPPYPGISPHPPHIPTTQHQTTL